MTQKPTFFLSFWLIVQSFVGIAQSTEPAQNIILSPYQLRTGQELILLGVGGASVATALALEQQIEPLTLVDLSAANASLINRFDRGATRQYNSSADRLSDVTLLGNAAILGGITLFTKPMRQDIKTVAVIYIETLLLANGIQRSIKSLTQRSRPFVYNPNVPQEDKLRRDARQSFFSGHATNAFATAVFTAEVFRHYLPDSRLKPVVWIGSLGLATVTAGLRYEGGLHYPTDLLVGAAFGSLIGWGIPKLHQVKANSRSALLRQLNVQPWSNGQASGLYIRLTLVSP